MRGVAPARRIFKHILKDGLNENPEVYRGAMLNKLQSVGAYCISPAFQLPSETFSEEKETAGLKIVSVWGQDGRVTMKCEWKVLYQNQLKELLI